MPRSTENSLAEGRLLHTDFAALLGSIRLADVVAPLHPGPHYMPRAEILGQYALVPLLGRLRRGRSSLERANFACEVPQGHIVDYKSSSTPCMDTMVAAGLSYKNVVVAMAAAGIPEDDPLRLRIVQMQGLVNKTAQPQYAEGLRGGFYWRPTLVHVWAEMARRLSIPLLEVQTATKNHWYPKEAPHSDKAVRMHESLDGVAEGLGFWQNPDTKDWLISVDQAAKMPQVGELLLPLLLPPHPPG